MKTAKPKYKVISERTFTKRQGTCYELIATLSVKEIIFKIKIHIEVDSYDFQSSATVAVWKSADLAWSNVANIPYKMMKSKALFYQHKHEPFKFAEDRAELLKLAIAILF